ncbi:MAG: hypothetical protein ACK56F_11325, partial [bacterium]
MVDETVWVGQSVDEVLKFLLVADCAFTVLQVSNHHLQSLRQQSQTIQCCLVGLLLKKRHNLFLFYFTT